MRQESFYLYADLIRTLCIATQLAIDLIRQSIRIMQISIAQIECALVACTSRLNLDE